MWPLRGEQIFWLKKDSTNWFLYKREYTVGSSITTRFSYVASFVYIDLFTYLRYIYLVTFMQFCLYRKQTKMVRMFQTIYLFWMVFKINKYYIIEIYIKGSLFDNVNKLKWHGLYFYFLLCWLGREGFIYNSYWIGACWRNDFKGIFIISNV